MSLIPIGRMENDKPLDTRVFVPFTDFYRLSLKNIKIACERHYRLAKSSCVVLVSDRSPFYTHIA